MPIEIRACADAADLRASMASIWHYFGLPPTDEAVGNFAVLVGPERALVAHVDGALAGGCCAFPIELTTPGGRVKAAGVTMVGVQPTHRRRGVLTAMMRRQLDDSRARGEAVAYLWASEERIYGRFGYGLTGLSADVEISRERAEFFTGAATVGRVRLVALAEALNPVRAIFAQVAATRPGMFARSDEWLMRRNLVDLSWMRAGGGELVCALLDIDGAPAAYALYRFDAKWERGGIPAGVVRVAEAMATTPEAMRAIWRYLLDLDWCATIKAGFLPVDHPLVLLAAEPRRMRTQLRDGCFARIVDVEAALRARKYGPGEIVIEIADAFCPWNAGRWLVRDDGATRTDRAADLSCDVSALASAYLGGFSWAQIVASCRAKAASEEAVTRADRVFERRGAPWVPEIF
ncbi:MAG: GNAT family N-acetyltransferase [Methylobacteriaceae bacterium]|nr:GNAT family N-acetyltransferase [Methylobacteriaceae bacterium]